MASDDFDLPALASYLQRDARDVEKLVARGRIPGRRVGGAWRFNVDEVHQWMEEELPALSDSELQGVEVGVQGGPKSAGASSVLVCDLMREETTAVPLAGRTAPGVIQKLVEVANATWQVYCPEEVLEAVKQREKLLSTAFPGGVAMPHPRRPLGDMLGESIVAFGRTSTSIPFGALNGQLTDIFFLVLCQDIQTHLQVLARLTRMCLREDFLPSLRAAESANDVLSLISAAEDAIVG
jgi:PTS system nitrogen regulatory IIA component